jgi:hypothetical protein
VFPKSRRNLRQGSGYSRKPKHVCKTLSEAPESFPQQCKGVSEVPEGHYTGVTGIRKHPKGYYISVTAIVAGKMPQFVV